MKFTLDKYQAWTLIGVLAELLESDKYDYFDVEFSNVLGESTETLIITPRKDKDLQVKS